MIITRTPLRISLCGGGTDMPSFYAHHPGAVVSTAIDKAIYVMVNPKFDGRYRVSYSMTENVDNVADIQHDIVRETLKLFNLKGLEVVSVSDIPGEGSGLGSSSAFTVGLLRALYAYCGNAVEPEQLAENAFAIESKNCGHTVGMQDHYAATFGGFNFYEFHKDRVTVKMIGLTLEDMDVIASNLMLFWTGMRPENGSESILKDQSERFESANTAAQSGIWMADLSRRLYCDLQNGRFERVGKFIHAGWKLKKNFSSRVSTDWIEALVDRAIRAGAVGAKICGAGGGGFLLVAAGPLHHHAVEKSVGLRRVPFKIGSQGSRVVYNGEYR